MKTRHYNRYFSLKEILKALGNKEDIGNKNTWIGKNYSKYGLINDLENIVNSEAEIQAFLSILKNQETDHELNAILTERAWELYIE